MENKNKKPNKVIITIISILLICNLIPLGIVGFTKIRTYFNDNTDNSGETDNDTEENQRSDIEKLVDYVPSVYDMYLSDGSRALDAYSGNNYTSDTIGDGILLYMASNNTKSIESEGGESIEGDYWFCIEAKCSGSVTFKVEDINKTLLSMYNRKDLSLELLGEENAENVYGIKTNEISLSLYSPYYIGIQSGGEPPYVKTSKIISNEKDSNNNLIVYEKAGFILTSLSINDSQSTEYYANIYKDTGNLFDTANVIKKIEDNNLSEKTAKEYIEDNWDLFNTFKHTFKLNSEGKYYWYSTEIE